MEDFLECWQLVRIQTIPKKIWNPVPRINVPFQYSLSKLSDEKSNEALNPRVVGEILLRQKQLILTKHIYCGPPMVHYSSKAQIFRALYRSASCCAFYFHSNRQSMTLK